MRALVLAGGSGTRLPPWTTALPKPLAPVGNRPVLGWVLDHLDTAVDIDRVGVIVRSDEVEVYAAIMGERTAAGRAIDWLAEPSPLGTGGALRHQRDYVGDDAVLVVPADIICPVDLSRLIAHHRQHSPLATVAAAPRDPARWDGDILVPDGTGLAASYLFKPGPGAPSRLGSTGAWVVDPALLDSMSPGVVDFSSEVLPQLPPCLGLFDTGEVYLRDIGTPTTFLAGNWDVLAGLAPVSLSGSCGNWSSAPEAEVEPGAQVNGPVLLGPGARVLRGARVDGPTVIGADAVITGSAHVDRCVVLPGSVVGGHLVDAIVGDPATALDVMRAFGAGVRS